MEAKVRQHKAAWSELAQSQVNQHTAAWFGWSWHEAKVRQCKAAQGWVTEIGEVDRSSERVGQ